MKKGKVYSKFSELLLYTVSLSKAIKTESENTVTKCDLRQQMTRSNNGLVPLFSRLSVW